MECSVLEGGRRMLTQSAFFEALGRPQRGNLARGKKSLEIQAQEGCQIITPPFLDAENLKPFISAELRARHSPVKFITLKGREALGYDATLLPLVCEVYLKAREAGVLTGKQLPVAQSCEVAVRTLAKIGIIALVDEATGYQYDRARNALQALLKTYIGEGLLKRCSYFPQEFWQGAYRLCGWEYKDGIPLKPHLLGTFINRTLYSKLPPEVHIEIKRLNPIKGATKRRKYRQWQLLTTTTGIPHLDKLLYLATAMMRGYTDREEFYRVYDLVVPTLPTVEEILAKEEVEV